MKTLLFLCTMISFISVAQTDDEIILSGIVLSESYAPIPSSTQVDTVKGDGKIRIKYSCLGATQYYVKLDILDHTTNDTLKLYTQMDVFYEHFVSNELVGQRISATASSKSSLLSYTCGYDIPKARNIYWLNGKQILILVDKI